MPVPLNVEGDWALRDIDFEVQWKINNAPDFLFNVRNPEETVKAVSESAMREVIGKSKIANVLAGYSLGEADLLRRAMGKKIAEEMAAQRDRFVKGATEKGFPEKKIVKLFDLILRLNPKTGQFVQYMLPTLDANIRHIDVENSSNSIAVWVAEVHQGKIAKIEPPPPIPFKYYGLSTTRIDGKRTAFFLDGEEIILAPEGYVVKKRYKVLRITASSVVMEDLDSKRQQTLTYTEEVGQNASGG